MKRLPIRTFLVHPMNLDSSLYITVFIYWTKQKRTLILHPFRGLLVFIPFLKALNNPLTVTLIFLGNAFKVEQMEYFEMRSNKRHGRP